jgi:hypothetical protein
MTNGWPGALAARELIRRLQHAPSHTVVVEVGHETYALLDVEYDEGLRIIRIKAEKDR